jgi:hypothetical protein
MLLLACTHAGSGRSGGPPSGDRAVAQRLYGVAEERYAAGDFDEAVSLMRHALLQLPPEPAHDRLRHQLLLRMAHTQLRAHASTGHAAPLHDAQQMLERYLERHEALFGDGDGPRAERGEVYELLFLVEQRLAPASDVVEPADSAPAQLARADEGPQAPGEAESPAPAEPAPAPATSAAEPEAAPASSTRRRPTASDDDDEVREVVVKKLQLASLDDPRVVERLRSDFSTGWAGLVLTKPGIELVHGPRPLVRGTSQLAGTGDRRAQQLARRAGQSLVRGARQPLRDCYAAAYARSPIAAMVSAVEASIHADGSVSHVRIVDGGLVDGHGDACIIEALQSAALEPLADAEEPVRVRVALTFFYEGAVSIVESTGEQLGPGAVMLRPNARSLEGMPPIEAFVK